MKEMILHILKHSFVDTLKILPFLFVAFLIIECIEHKVSSKFKNIVGKTGKFGPIIGGFFGLIPQCGFSVLATNFYITRVISLGTLISIYLSTSDEMLPIMLSYGVGYRLILLFLGVKFVFGFLFGYIIDFIFKNKFSKFNYDLCDKDHCDCQHSLLKSSLIHTLNIFLFILVTTIGIDILFELYGEDIVSKVFLKDSLFGPFIGALIGLIPNCAASVALTELFLNNAIGIGTCISGLLTGSGVAILVLFKTNKNFKENLFIISSLYLIGVLVGIFIDLLSILV